MGARPQARWRVGADAPPYDVLLTRPDLVAVLEGCTVVRRPSQTLRWPCTRLTRRRGWKLWPPPATSVMNCVTNEHSGSQPRAGRAEISEEQRDNTILNIMLCGSSYPWTVDQLVREIQDEDAVDAVARLTRPARASLRRVRVPDAHRTAGRRNQSRRHIAVEMRNIHVAASAATRLPSPRAPIPCEVCDRREAPGYPPSGRVSLNSR
jgi:hypothetical protein